MRHLVQWWSENFSNAYWLIPLLWLAGGTGAAIILKMMVEGGGGAMTAKGQSALIILVVGSSLTVISMLLSGSLVALTLTTNQFGPRLLRGFLHDHFNKQVLGSYLGLSAFGLFILLGLANEPPSALSSRVAVWWLVGNLLLLVIFIHRLIQSMIVERVLDQTCKDIQTATSPLVRVDCDIPHDGEDTTSPVLGQGPDILWPDSGSEGYIMQIDYEKLVRSLEEQGACLDLCVTSGHWLTPGEKVASATPRSEHHESPEDLADIFAASCHIGLRRTPIQDERFAFERITEVALRALSPGIHDPFTAITCIERAGSELRNLASCDTWPPPPVSDSEGIIRLRAARASVGSLAETTFKPLINLPPAPMVMDVLRRELVSLRRQISGKDAKKLDDLIRLSGTSQQSETTL